MLVKKELELELELELRTRKFRRYEKHELPRFCKKTVLRIKSVHLNSILIHLRHIIPPHNYPRTYTMASRHTGSDGSVCPFDGYVLFCNG